jgi:glycosyltransferase involved in cell wall biosynthesis
VKLAYVLGTFPALTETFILGEIEALRAVGHEPALFALRRPRGQVDRTQGADLVARTRYGESWPRGELWRANRAALRRAPGRYLRTLAAVVAGTALNPVYCLKSLGIFPVAVAFAEQMRELGIEHVHAHWANYPATAAYVVARLLDIPYSFTAHVYDATLIRSLLREKVRRAAFVVTCNEWIRRRIASLVPESGAKVMINYHGATLDRFVPNGHGAPRRRPQIVSCGSLYPRKGFQVLLEACRALRDRGVEFDCTIIGEGPLRPRLERFIARHALGDLVRLAGGLPQGEVIDHYRRADLFVLPCVTDYLGWDEIASDPILLLAVGPAIPFRPLTDGIPNVLVEAMAMKLPVVSTYVAGVPELVQDGHNGLLVPEKDAAALTDAIQRLLADAGLRRRLGERGRETVLRRFDRSKNIRELVNVFSQGLHSPSVPTREQHHASGHARA